MIDIANYHEVQVETVRTIIRRMSDARSGRKIGRPLKLNDEMLEKLNTFVDENGFLPLAKLAAGFGELTNVQKSKSTLCRYTTKLGLHS